MPKLEQYLLSTFEEDPPYTQLNYERLGRAMLADAGQRYMTAARHPEETYSYPQRVQRFKTSIGAGVMPPLENGFQFVVDHRPTGHEDDYISPEEYTRYFSEGKIPVAAQGHRLHDHDCTHGPNFQTLFANLQFARLAGNAAANALATGESEAFTSAMDGFSDHMLVLEAMFLQTNANAELGSVLTAERHLKTLIGLGGGTAEYREELFQNMHVNLGLARYNADFS